MNPRDSVRKILGIYERELNTWIERALHRVNRVVDVGANDGYFTFGSAAAFKRFGREAEIIAFEPDDRQVEKLRVSRKTQETRDIRFQIIPSFVGATESQGVTTLDALSVSERSDTLLKIDVEGAELEVIKGADAWKCPSNLFLIEVHNEKFLTDIVHDFAVHGHKLIRIDQSPHPVLGPEKRAKQNWWLVSDLRPNF